MNLPTLIDIAQPIVLSLLSWIAVLIGNHIRAKTQNAIVGNLLFRLNDAAFTAVKSIEQTLASDLRAASADGSLSPEAKKALLGRALTLTKDYFGQQGLGQLSKILGWSTDSIDTHVTANIEAAVQGLKHP